jgi:hypothetical protein
MPIIYNIEPAKIDLFAIQGDSIHMDFFVNVELTSLSRKFYLTVNIAPSTGTPFHIDSLHLQVRRKDGLLLKDWISGISPSDIVINPSADGQFSLYDVDGFLESGLFDYDLQVDTGAEIFTLMTGNCIVKKQITP